MGVTIRELLELPCLKEAHVAAGAAGLDRVVTSVSVLEYSVTGNVQDAFYEENAWSGGELVISALAGVAHDVEAQCRNVRNLAAVGEIGLVLFYVGILIPRVDERVQALCDELGFPLIVMPENRLNLRYSEVICEVFERILQDRQGTVSLMSDVLNQVAGLREHQRSVDTVVKMLSDHVRSSAVLTDARGRVLNAVAWPRTLEFDPECVVKDRLPAAGSSRWEQQVAGRQMAVCRIAIEESSTPMQLFFLTEGEPLSTELIRQGAEVVRLAANLWSRDHAQVVVSELVRAILKDEPIKMRRLAEIFHIDVASIHSMWVVECEGGAKERFLQCAPEFAREALAHRCSTVVADVYEGALVAFMDWPAAAGDCAGVTAALVEHFAAQGMECSAVFCQELPDTTAVREAYLTIRESLFDGRKIWPGQRVFSLQEARFAKRCRGIVERGENALQEGMRPLSPLKAEREEAELCRTLAVYLLDAAQNVSDTADRLFLHKNTVKYRLQRISARLGSRVGKLPELFELYRACALERLVNS